MLMNGKSYLVPILRHIFISSALPVLCLDKQCPTYEFIYNYYMYEAPEEYSGVACDQFTFSYLCLPYQAILLCWLLLFNVLDPVVQSIVSLTISLRHKFVKQISAKVTNTLLFFVEKM